MAKKEKKLEMDNGLDKKLSQEARLKDLTKKMYVVVGTAVIFLLAFIYLTSYSRKTAAEQLETTMFLNQYRTGSKNLTTAVQSYAVTGDEQYYQNYMDELNVVKNRDIAWAGLQANDIKANEWAMLEEIAGMSNGLVPLEEESMNLVSQGRLEEAAAIPNEAAAIAIMVFVFAVRVATWVVKFSVCLFNSSTTEA